MRELWRRIVFTIMISNIDDHLRNHAFIYERYRGWRLSPVYDLNPVPREVAAPILKTAINFKDSSASLENAMGVASDFGLKKDEASLIVQEVAHSVKKWRTVATRFSLSKEECDRMASAFNC